MNNTEQTTEATTNTMTDTATDTITESTMVDANQDAEADTNEAGCDTLESKRVACEVWTRVMGYHRPVTSFNIGKKSEHYSRTHFKETACANSQFCKEFQM